MKVMLSLVFLALCLVSSTQAWGWGGWGYGGYGLGYGGYGYGLGYGLGYGGYGLGYGGLGYGGWGLYKRGTEKQQVLPTHVQCRFINETGVVSCATHTGVVECGVVANFTGTKGEFKTEYFGIGIDRTLTGVPVELTRYHLFPRTSDNNGWCNHTVTVNNQVFGLGFFHSITYNGGFYGYRVIDGQCFTRLVNLFTGVKTPEIIQIKNKVGGPFTKVPIFGEILTVV